MTKLTVPDPVAETFAALHEEVVVYNEEGLPLGFFRPAISTDPKDYDLARSRISDAELERRAAERAGGITTAELLAKLAVIPLKSPESSSAKGDVSP